MIKSPSDTELVHGHRERLRDRFVQRKMMPFEHFELMLAGVIPRRDVRKLTQRLIKHFGGMYNILTAPLDALIEFPGLGRASAIAIKNLQELYICALEERFRYDQIFYNDKSLHDYCRMLVGGKPIEEFHVLYLGYDRRLLNHELHSTGNETSSDVDIGKIIQHAKNYGARRVVFVHNHPTPLTSFSPVDRDMTRATYNMLRDVNIELYEHLVVSGDIVYSAVNMHILERHEYDV
ncbi:RadC family protein [bacterium]|nr:RadC family protein [bacterium]